MLSRPRRRCGLPGFGGPWMNGAGAGVTAFGQCSLGCDLPWDPSHWVWLVMGVSSGTVGRTLEDHDPQSQRVGLSALFHPRGVEYAYTRGI